MPVEYSIYLNIKLCSRFFILFYFINFIGFMSSNCCFWCCYKNALLLYFMNFVLWWYNNFNAIVNGSVVIQQNRMMFKTAMRRARRRRKKVIDKNTNLVYKTFKLLWMLNKSKITIYLWCDCAKWWNMEGRKWEIWFKR